MPQKKEPVRSTCVRDLEKAGRDVALGFKDFKCHRRHERELHIGL